MFITVLIILLQFFSSRFHFDSCYNKCNRYVSRQKQLDVKEQKHLRRKLREEKRKATILQKLQIGSTDEINSKIAKEEKKLLKVQQKLEAIRLVEELYKRIKVNIYLHFL